MFFDGNGINQGLKAYQLVVIFRKLLSKKKAAKGFQ